jgi:hypothetical protein
MAPLIKVAQDDPEPAPCGRLTMSVAEFAEISGLSQYTVREELALGRIPYRRVGRRGLIRILRIPAIAALGGYTTVPDIEEQTEA